MIGLTALNATPFPALQNRFPSLNQLALQQQAANYAPAAEAQLPQIQPPDAEAALNALGPSSGPQTRPAGQPAQTWPGLVNALVQGVASPFLHLFGAGAAPTATAGGVSGVSPGWGLNTAFADQSMAAPQGGVLAPGWGLNTAFADQPMAAPQGGVLGASF